MGEDYGIRHLDAFIPLECYITADTSNLQFKHQQKDYLLHGVKLAREVFGRYSSFSCIWVSIYLPTKLYKIM